MSSWPGAQPASSVSASYVVLIQVSRDAGDGCEVVVAVPDGQAMVRDGRAEYKVDDSGCTVLAGLRQHAARGETPCADRADPAPGGRRAVRPDPQDVCGADRARAEVRFPGRTELDEHSQVVRPRMA